MAPPAPTVDAVASPTRSNPVTLTGRAEPAATVQVRGGSDAIASGSAGTDGRFSIGVAIRPDATSSLLVSQIAGGRESMATSVMVTHDGTAPATPVLEAVTTPTRRPMQQLRGRAEHGSAVRVTGGAADAMGNADAMGRFDVAITLRTAASGTTTNVLSVVAADAAGNESGPAMATIVHNPDLAVDTPMLDRVATPTRSASITISGSAEPSVRITVAGATSPATGDAGADGRFSVPVMLRSNVENVLTVFAVAATTGLTSAGVVVSVVHDDIAPDAPVLDPVASPTGAETIAVSGQSEPLAEVTVAGGVELTTATADASGRFSASVRIARDATSMLMVTATDLAGNEGAPEVISVQQDSSLPVPVTVDPPASPTRSNPVVLTGRTEASATVQVTGGAAAAMAAATESGAFSVSVVLVPNARNELHVTRAGASVETIVVVVHDTLAPRAPVLNAIPSPTNRRDVDVAGTTEPGANVSVSGATAPGSGTAGPDGRFSVRVAIAADATSTLAVVATDLAGNTSPASTATVTHSSTAPDAPVVDVLSPPPTRMPTYSVRGHVTMPAAGLVVRVTGGGSTATGPTDPSTGAFALDVMLAPNSVNELHVVTVQGDIESPETIVTITHDDVAPAAPDGALITVASPPPLSTCPLRTSLSVTGAMSCTEAAATVRLTNMATSATVSVTATGGGSFSTSIAACRGDILSIIAVDAAANDSAPTEKTVL